MSGFHYAPAPQSRLLQPGLLLLAPALFALAAVVLSAAALFAPAPLLPHWPLLVVGVWALYQPALMPPWLALLTGILTDATLGLPIGVNATLLPLLACALGFGLRRQTSRPIGLDWMLAAAVIAAYLWAQTGLAALGGVARPAELLLPQMLVSWALFPAVTRLSAVVYNRLTRSA